MSSYDNSATDFLARLKSFLEHGPESQDASLESLLQELATFREEPEKTTLENAFESFGTAVGKQKAWQTPFREAGILSLALDALDSDETTTPLRKQYFRVIGNCVADNDTNREVVTTGLQKLVVWLLDESLATIVFIVLFNLCNDFDPAKAATAALRLDALVAENLFLDRIPEQAIDYAIDLLTWTTDKLTAEQLKDNTSLKVFSYLLSATLQYDEDHYHEHIAILVHYLQDPEFQQRVAVPELLDDLVTLVLDFETRMTATEIEAVFQELAIAKTDEKSPSDETSVLLLTQLINSVSAVSATDAFAQNFNARNPLIERIRAKLNYSSTEYMPSTVCACVILGNLAMADEICIDMVSIMQLHEPLISILSSAKHSALLYATAGFLRHLAFPEANRTILGHAGLTKACHTLIITSTDAAVRGEIAALLCKLVTNNVDNVTMVVSRKVVEDPIESDGLLSLSEDSNSILEDVVKQALAPASPLPSTSMKNPMIELGRTIIAILRYIGRPNAESDVESLQQDLLAVPKVARPLAGLVRQRFYADARSEGLLGLGLLAQSMGGAAHVIEELEHDPGLLEAIKDSAEGKDGGTAQQGSANGRDYQNAIVLLQALQNNWGEASREDLKNQVADLQEQLGKLMVG